MATTLYFTTSTNVDISPSDSSAWSAGTASTDFTRRVMSESDSGSTTDRETTETAAGEYCQAQYISAKKLRAQTISGSYDLSLTQRSTVTGATYSSCHVRIVTSNGSNRGTLDDHTVSSTLIDGTYSSNILGGSFSSVACQDGDYVVVEVGYDTDTATSKTMGTRVGSGYIDMSDTLLWLEPPANLVYPITSETQLIDDPINTNTPTWTDNGGTFTFTVATGALPTGVSLNATTGVISGNPSVDGTFTFTIQVANSEGSTTSNSITYIVDPPLNCTQLLNDMMSGKMEIG